MPPERTRPSFGDLAILLESSVFCLGVSAIAVKRAGRHAQHMISMKQPNGFYWFSLGFGLKRFLAELISPPITSFTLHFLIEKGPHQGKRNRDNPFPALSRDSLALYGTTGLAQQKQFDVQNSWQPSTSLSASSENSNQ